MPLSESTPKPKPQIASADLPYGQLREYHGGWVAFSPDGSRLITGAATLALLEAKLREAGENPEEVLLEQIPHGDSIPSGSELS